jgi:molecular chaperone DnaJ
MDFYIVLGIERGATVSDIKRAYKRLARRFHPDINPGDRMAAAQFRQIAEAYETLVDPDRRRRYDAAGHHVSAEPVSYGFEGFDFSATVSGSSATTFGDLFADVINQRTQRDVQGQEWASIRGSDLHQSLDLTFEDAMRGGQRAVTVMRQEHCRTCKGTGVLHIAETRCGQCQGTGVVKTTRGHMVFSRPCSGCDGSGRRRQARCPTCHGQQVETRSEPFTVNVPGGLADGARVRVPGKGHAGRNGGDAGDLYITVRVQPHPTFRREGDDLHIVVPIAIHEAALGAKVDVPTLEGTTRLRVPQGTQSGQRFRLRERGVMSPRDGRRGDLVVEVRLVLPKLLDERSKELLREFGKINHENVRGESGSGT